MGDWCEICEIKRELFEVKLSDDFSVFLCSECLEEMDEERLEYLRIQYEIIPDPEEALGWLDGVLINEQD